MRCLWTRFYFYIVGDFLGKILKFPLRRRLATESDDSKQLKDPSFSGFLDKIQNKKIDEAALDLESLLFLSRFEAKEAAHYFNQKYHEDESYMGKLLQLNFYVHSNAFNDSLMLIFECFRVQGTSALAALDAITQLNPK